MSYANDGKCHNAEPGTYNHECGNPAQWVGTTVRTGYSSGFCDKCKRNGYEAREVDCWLRVDFSEVGKAHVYLRPAGL